MIFKFLPVSWGTVNPLLSLLGAYLFQAHLRGARRARIWEGGGLIEFRKDDGISSA